MTHPALIATNLAGVIEAPRMGSTPFNVDRGGHPFVPIGDGGVVCGIELGQGVFATDTDHAAPGACVTHPEPGALHALTSFACLGNAAVMRSGAAAGSRGIVLGKRGEAGRVIVCFPQDVLARIAPGDDVAIRCHGQGAALPTVGGADSPVHVMNVSPAAFPALPIDLGADPITVGVRTAIPSFLAGNGIGRPAHQWDIDIQVDASSADQFALGKLRLGDLLAISNLDVRHNAGYRRGWTTVGLIVHGSSPQPGHGPGLMPILCGPTDRVSLRHETDSHQGLTFDALARLAVPNS